MEKSLDSEQKTEYKFVRDAFKKIQDDTNKEIAIYKIDLQKAKQKISNLEKEIDSSRPMIEDCDKHIVCKNCDIYSMKYLGSTPNPEKYYIYGCVICGHEESST